MKFLIRIFFVAAIALTIYPLQSRAQVVPTADEGGFGHAYVFAEFTAGRPNYKTDFIVGPTLGGYYQLNHWVAAEARGSILKWGPSPFHQDFALFGPRIQYPGHRLKPYASVDFGIAHVTYPVRTVDDRILTSSTEWAWQAAAGVDYRLTPRLSWRMGEFTYGAVDVLQNGLNPKSFSTGIVVRVF